MAARTVAQLREEDSWNSHAEYGRDAWKFEVHEGNTQRGYWDWVELMLELEAEDDGDESATPSSSDSNEDEPRSAEES